MADSLPRLPSRSDDSHKGDYGRALLIGGSRGMAGAIALAGMSTLRSGAGLVKLAVPDICVDTVAGFEPSYMTMSLASDAEGRISSAAAAKIFKAAAEATVVACGPGLGKSPDLLLLVGRLYQELQTPLVLDADALNVLAEQSQILGKHAGPRILTPHPGEFARLHSRDRIAAEERPGLARSLAKIANVVVVLKGHRTLITDGEREAVNSTGNPGMATGGTGDVLTGVITGLLCQGLEPFEAAQLGVYAHGLAGDLAAEKLGQVGMIASDLVRFLPHALKQLEGSPNEAVPDDREEGF